MPYNNRSTAAREKLVLQVGKPVTIALEYSTAIGYLLPRKKVTVERASHRGINVFADNTANG